MNDNSEILTVAKVKKMSKAKLLRIMADAGLPICRDFSREDCVDAVLAYIGDDDAE